MLFYNSFTKKIYLIILFNYFTYLFYEKRPYFIARNVEYFNLSLIYLASLIEREICVEETNSSFRQIALFLHMRSRSSFPFKLIPNFNLTVIICVSVKQRD